MTRKPKEITSIETGSEPRSPLGTGQGKSKYSRTEALVVGSQVDLMKSREFRPLIWPDVNDWWEGLGLPSSDIDLALMRIYGYRNTNQLKAAKQDNVLQPTREILQRLFFLEPRPQSWWSLTLPELFDEMYGAALKKFEGTILWEHARVDLGARFCRMFDRSPGRQFEWLWAGKSNTSGHSEPGGSSPGRSYTDVSMILLKLKDFDNPGKVFESVALQTWAVRGVDLNKTHPIPTPDSPPKRSKVGRVGNKNFKK